MTLYSLFATTPKAMESVLANEITALGGQEVRQKVAGVAFQGDLNLAYRACLWLRTANRVLLPLHQFQVNSQQDLYDGVQQIDWSLHLNPGDSLAVSFSAKNSPTINNTHFGALKVKDAIVDQMRARFGSRPSVDTERPNIRINVYLHDTTAQLSLDLSGESLHKRQYRDSGHAAPLKENLAAAILLRSGWPAMAAQGATLLDPMCGSGTLLLEGAMIAANIAPGLQREYFGFLGWKQHDPALWQALLAEAQQLKQQGIPKLPTIVGYDRDSDAVAMAVQHIEQAGLHGKVHVERREIEDAAPAASWPKGLLVCNPPYGERLGETNQIAPLYRRMGEVFKQHFQGWKGAMIIADQELGFRLGIRSSKPITLFNGALECKLLRFDIQERAFFEPKSKTQDARVEQVKEQASHYQAEARAEMFANRLRKNLKRLGKWAEQQQISCYRVYDADLPEYAVAVDLYQGERLWVHVQEYESPKTVDAEKADQRLAGIMAELPEVLQIPPQQIYLKIRRRQRNTDQYEKQGSGGLFHKINEAGCQILVNFEDYLDTGLFLDHRPMRLKIQQQAHGKRFLNLFAYTATATVHAARGGANASVSVDMSKTYLEWAQRNFNLNGMGNQHQLVRADCVQWLAEQVKLRNKPKFDLIFLDPPTFSNSKRMDNSFDVQTQHVELINHASQLLTPGGVLYFSTNFRRFKLDHDALAHLTIKDISLSTIPEDFARDSKIHYCWSISRD